MKKIFTRLTVLTMALLILVSPVLAASTSEPVPASNPSEPTPSEVKAALHEFKSLSKKERKARVKDAKRELKKFKAEKRNGKEPSDNTVLLVILAILLPPLAVYLHEGEINNKFWISLILTLLFWIPGVIYALIVVLSDN
ncbi:MAG TPA: YqaE/Pmp3 family membrane protein [Chitinophagaceae bacterium]|nr:YqaE/Pmp3 family membrane protein [Chitinophagaceae bacterium]